MGKKVDRREFMKIGLVGGAGIGFAALGPIQARSRAAETPAPAKAMPKRPLGRTGHQVALFSLGGQARLEQRGSAAREEAVGIIHRALDLGVNYCDTAPLYGPSQDYLGEVLKTRRSETFLASKTDDRSRDGSLRLLENSLKRLTTDHLDRWQVHHVSDREDLDSIFRPGGSLQALVKARDEKMVRFLGITGHYDPASLLEGIRRFDFDCILMALNAADPHHLSFQEKLLGAAAGKKMGVIGMKVPARGRLLAKSGLTMRECVDYVWSLPVSTVIIGCDSVRQLDENVALARRFQPISPASRAALESRTRAAAGDCAWYKRGASEPWG